LSIPHTIITDGDPSDTDKGRVLAGLRRGKNLVGDDETREEVKRLIEAKKHSEAKTALADEGIFVGDHTLEIDLLDQLADEMKSTYAELRNSDTSSQKFSKSVDSAIKGDGQAIADVLARIERIGKGRFAQRLAGKIDKQAPPSYIGKAIKHMVRLLGHNDA
jgi:putative ATP-dependent endonuclease of OLD family